MGRFFHVMAGYQLGRVTLNVILGVDTRARTGTSSATSMFRGDLASAVRLLGGLKLKGGRGREGKGMEGMGRFDQKWKKGGEGKGLKLFMLTKKFLTILSIKYYSKGSYAQ